MACTSIQEINYSTVTIVLETWDAARFGAKNFDSELGIIALERLFEMQPRSKSVFGFDQGDEVGWGHSLIHAKAFASFFDSILQMLGPDIEFMQDILKQVGRRHKNMGVSPSFFPYMGQALIHALEELAGQELNEGQREAWETVFDAVSNEIVKHILSDDV